MTPPKRVADPVAVGQITHQAIAALLAANERHPTFDQLLETVAPFTAAFTGHARHAVAVQVISEVSLYFRWFAPQDDVKFVGAEIRVPGARLDLLFQEPAYQLTSDEIKTGRVARVHERLALEEQVERALAGGLARYGSDFVGVRAVILGAPRRSYLLTASSGAKPLYGESV